MSFYKTTKEKFIEIASKWDKENIVIRQNYNTSEWWKAGYIKVNIDIPMSEYSFVQVSLTDYGRAILEFDKL